MDTNIAVFKALLGVATAMPRLLSNQDECAATQVQ
jgi:hypothetical protein